MIICPSGGTGAGIGQGDREPRALTRRALDRTFGFDPGHGVGYRLLVGTGALTVEFGIAPNRGQWRPQFVGRVGHKAAQALLVAVALLVALLDLPQHFIERSPEAAEFGPRIRVGHSPGEIARKR